MTRLFAITMFGSRMFTKLDAFGVQAIVQLEVGTGFIDCGLTGDSCGQPLFTHKPGYWYKSTAQMSRDIKQSMRHSM
ncbi:hypothetical protein GUITHDRAFT_111872 [Guillardia theta CCMP2712]|uniref:Uncharacterized protein n=1 Tax=Guillardia theta (strain CCMP2712) TaxID=905079 RepID=L1J118_GUITC|nr:hypothetical protein GUITHDRAFT_111872 [Guillardia theta CCMP2712]EKX42017.1 hypothetical protein GUITHDRAFT_111872 [Guillardia theta CCMP2712]|eukprot:XP_005828997.1 hypothetical protein GUITHDRAFT_111872 [Guillardia theta CCMP2712]